MGRDSRGNYWGERFFGQQREVWRPKTSLGETWVFGRIPRFSGARDYHKNIWHVKTLEDWDIFPTVGVTVSQRVNVYNTRCSKCISYIILNTVYIYLYTYTSCIICTTNFSFQTNPHRCLGRKFGTGTNMEVKKLYRLEAKNPKVTGKSAGPAGDLCRYGMYLCNLWIYPPWMSHAPFF